MPGRVINQAQPSNVSSNMSENATKAPALEPPLPLPNGVAAKPAPLDANQSHPPHNESHSSAMASPALPKDLKTALQALPPELPQLLHVTDGYQPLSKLFERAAQDCFNSLNETIIASQDTPRPRMVNGNTGSADHDAPSATKRLRWLQFANTNRERFIKLLVLLQWSRQARGDIGQLVDVVSWMRQLLESYDDLEDYLGLLKREMADVKIPSPDIDTALEVLTTGQSSQMPDLSYLPRPPASARSVLKTLRNLNTLLHIRLNVYENLPRPLRRFKIASGRVTFTVPDEFELDLSIFDEDPSTHFYFLDIRFLFTPGLDLPDGALRAELERRTNAALASGGLAGCYDALHDFTLTCKLSVLRQQALTMARQAWTGAIRVERVHRILIVQYWIDSKQKKSWIEIGIKSGKHPTDADSWRGDDQSQLFVKWVRAGKEVAVDGPSPLDLAGLDVEAILESIIGQHIHHLVGSAKNKLAGSSTASLSTPCLSALQDQEDPDSCLEIRRCFAGASTLRIEPISGKFSLSPKSPSSARCENSLNNLTNPEEDLGAKLRAWQAYDGSAAFKESVIRYGWEVVTSIQLAAATRKHYFGDSSAVVCFVKHWSNPSWVVAAMPNPNLAFSLWIFNVEEPNSQTLWLGEGFKVRHAFKIESDVKTLSADFFSRLDRLCIASVSSHLVRSRLAQLAVPFAALTSAKLASPLAFSTLSLDVSRMMQGSITSGHVTLFHFGRAEATRAGLHLAKSSSSPQILHVAKGSLAGTQESNSMLTAIRSPHVGFLEDGTFVILDQSSVFSPLVVDNILRKLRHIVQLQACLENLKRHRFRVVSVTLNSLAFSYASGTPNLQARLAWSESGEISLSLAPKMNPHNRLLSMFGNLLQSASTNSTQANTVTSVLTQFTRSLLLTLNLLRVFDTLESRGGAIVNIKALGKYDIVYERPRCKLVVTLRQDQGRSWWYIEQDRQSPRSNEKLQVALKSFMSESGEGVMGLFKGIAAEAKVVDKVIERLDERIRACADGEEPRSKKPQKENKGKTSAPAEAATTPAKKEKPQSKNQPKKQQAEAKQPNGTVNGDGAGNGNGNRNANNGNGKPEVVVLD